MSFDDFNKDVDEKREHLLFVVVLEITSLRVVDVDDDFDDDFDDFENKTGGFVTAANILGKRSLKDADESIFTREKKKIRRRGIALLGLGFEKEKGKIANKDSFVSLCSRRG